MDRLTHFRAAFLDALGALIQTVPIPAESVTMAASRAAEIASQIEATDFYITSAARYPQRGRLTLQ